MRRNAIKKMVLGGFFVFLQAFLNSATIANIYNELYFLPWLVAKGQVPYRDFFDHHGFLIYLLLSPFSSIDALKLVLLFIQTISLLLFFFLLRRFNLKTLALGGTLFILYSFLTVQNTLSYDSFLVPFFLGIAVLLQREEVNPVRKIGAVIGVLVASMTLIKFLPGFLLLGLILCFKKIRVTAFISFILSWFLALWYLFHNSAFADFIDGYFRFNSFLFKTMPLFKFDGIFDPQFPVLGLILFGLMTWVVLVIKAAAKDKAMEKSYFTRDELIYVGLILSSLGLLASGVGIGHLLPVVPFIGLLVMGRFAKLQPDVKNRVGLVLAVIIIGLVLLTVRTFRHLNLKTSEYVLDPKGTDIVRILNSRNLTNKKFFINDGYVNVYYYLNQVPPTKYPMKFPLMVSPRIEDYDTSYEASLINSLSKNDVEVVVWVVRPYQQWGELAQLYKVVQDTYVLRDVVDTKNVKVELYENELERINPIITQW